MKKKLLLLASLALAFSITACSSSTPSAPPAQAPPAQAAPQQSTESSAAPVEASSDLTALVEASFEGPVMLTSVGQSADVNIINTLFSRSGIDSSMSNTLTENDLGGYKTLVLAIGGSSKGLGAAGIDENQELARVSALIEKAKADGIRILAMHIGGSARRGVLSDMFIPNSIENADAAIILSEGDTDNLMRDILVSKGIPTEYIETQIDSLEPIKILFGK